MNQKIIVYLPVIHKGYLDLFLNYPKSEILIIDESVIALIDQEFDYLRKEIRSINPNQAEVSLRALLPKQKIKLLRFHDLLLLNTPNQKLILPYEDIFIWLKNNYLQNTTIQFEKTFLRWNKTNTVEKRKLQNEIKQSNELVKLMEAVFEKAKQTVQLSSDWWRQVGAVIFEEKTLPQNEQQFNIIFVAYNHHLPSPYTPYIDSDPRNSFHKGENITLSTAIHAEASLIAQSAKNGISLQGKSMYVSTFPCPVCAKQIAASGICKLYYSEGYSMLDGERVLSDAAVQVTQIK